MVRSVTLFEPVVFGAAALDDPAALQGHDDIMSACFAAIEAGDLEMAARLFNRMWSSPGSWEAMPQRARDAMIRAIRVVPDTDRFLFQDAYGLLAPGVFEALDVPTLLMRGEKALPAIAAINAGLARRLGNASEVVIEGAGHMAPISHPKPVAEAMRGIWAKA